MKGLTQRMYYILWVSFYKKVAIILIVMDVIHYAGSQTTLKMLALALQPLHRAAWAHKRSIHAYKAPAFSHLASLLPWGWLEHLVEMSASCTPNIKLSTMNLCCFYTTLWDKPECHPYAYAFWTKRGNPLYGMWVNRVLIVTRELYHECQLPCTCFLSTCVSPKVCMYAQLADQSYVAMGKHLCDYDIEPFTKSV